MARRHSQGRRLSTSSARRLSSRDTDTEKENAGGNDRDAREGIARRADDEPPLANMMNRTRTLLFELDKPADAQEAPLAGLHALQDTLLQYSGSAAEADEELPLDWDLYQAAPVAMVQEEELLLDYFRKLKFIYLEQETKLRFLADLQDDPETGQEPQILSAADVAQREGECKRVKQQLVDAKKRVRDARTEIDALADAMHPRWEELSAGRAEAAELLSGITDMELELAKIKAAEGSHGAMTTEEAEAMCDEQIVRMQAHDDETTAVAHELDRTKRELAEALRALERLRGERAAAEKRANEVTLGMGRDRGRDWELERLCAKHASTLDNLQDALAIHALSAPAENVLHITFAADSASAPTARRTRSRKRSSSADDAALRTLELEFDAPGGQLLRYELRHQRDETMVPLSEPLAVCADAAMRSNNVAAVVLCVWQGTK
ncbi:hypothetical protein MSPP1_003828 [Malassezia sp. CBS 17886]|nr:hypothetical protein MSPP1_003828 [Malassezia sp. CBS 17886]